MLLLLLLPLLLLLLLLLLLAAAAAKGDAGFLKSFTTDSYSSFSGLTRETVALIETAWCGVSGVVVRSGSYVVGQRPIFCSRFGSGFSRGRMCGEMTPRWERS